MPSSGLFGPHVLDAKSINAVFQRTGPGAYMLGEVGADGTFYVSYVGRSDADIKVRLNTHASAGRYGHFMYGIYPTAQAAWAKECELFHMFGELALDNQIHPAGTGECPHCGC